MKYGTRVVALIVVILAGAAQDAAAQAAPDALHIDITRVDRRTAVAVPDFATAPGQEALGRELADIVRYDLDFTCLFSLLPRDRFPRNFTGFTADASRIDFPAWAQTGIEFLIYAYITVEQDRIVAESRLFEVKSGRQYVGKRFAAGAGWKRMIGHQFADEIVLALTGVAGIATSQICFSGGTTGDKEIYVVDYDGANLKQVTAHSSVSILPQFSPDGNRIAYLSFKDRFPFLYILDLTTGKSAPLSRDVGLNASPAWAPDGDQLAIVLSKDANAEIYLVNPDGAGKRRVTNSKSLETSPTFHPNGNEIAFVSDRLGGAQIFASALDESNLRRLSFQGGRSYDPEWSPDGKQIAYVVEMAGEGFEIYVMNADGSAPRRLTNSPGSNESPSWSKDSRHIVFASTRSGRSELWTVNVETGTERRIPNLNLSSQGPSWGPRRP